MYSKLLFPGIDEFTLVLSTDKSAVEDIEDWQPKAESMITEFAHLANLESIFGEQKELEAKCPQGYSVGYQYGDNPFYFAVAYHPSHPQMGVVVKFSAYSWFEYRKSGNTNIKRFLLSVKSDLYSFRLSRIDFTADYLDWRTTVNEIYRRLISNDWEIQDSKGRRSLSEINALEVNGMTNTFYIGSRKTGTRLFLRVYDKKAEQMENKGFLLKEALGMRSWVRFEAVFKGVYAHQLTNIIMSTEENSLNDLIADKIAEKYRFYDRTKGKYTDFSTALLNQSKRHFQHLHLESPRDNDLISSLLHLMNGSGLFPILYKCDKIWGKETSTILLKYLHNVYKNKYKPNDDVRSWVKKHKKTLARQSLEAEFELLKAFRLNVAKEDLSA